MNGRQKNTIFSSTCAGNGAELESLDLPNVVKVMVTLL